MSRPKAPDARQQRITVRVNADEFIKAHVNARKHGQTVAEFARARILKPARKRKAPRQHLAELPALHPEVHREARRIGVNINQIAHRLNATGQCAPAELLVALSDLRRLINAALIRQEDV